MTRAIMREIGFEVKKSERYRNSLDGFIPVWDISETGIKYAFMNPYSQLSPALSHNQFYVLLALSGTELHRYDIRGAVHAGSLGTVRIGLGRTYDTIKEMLSRGWVEEAGIQEAGKQGKPRMTYRITPEGTLRLKDDLRRMKFAVDTGEQAGLFFD